MTNFQAHKYYIYIFYEISSVKRHADDTEVVFTLRFVAMLYIVENGTQPNFLSKVNNKSQIGHFHTVLLLIILKYNITLKCVYMYICVCVCVQKYYNI